MNDPTTRLKEISRHWLDTRDAFRDVIEAGPPPPESSFAEDLSVVLARESSLPQAAALLNYAFDSADVLERMWHVPVHHVPSDYVLMRAMVDNAIRVIWLIDPDVQGERLIRAWQLARDAPARSKARATTMLKEDPQRSIAEELRATAANAKTYIAQLDAAFSEALGTLPTPRFLQAADFIAATERQPLHAGIDGGVARLWSQLSELVHGSIVSTEHRMVADPPEGHVRLTRANVEDIALAAGLVTRILDGALDRFYTRFDAAISSI